jgi:quinol monooxygenase YgiN
MLGGMGRMVIACFRPLPGKRDALRELTRTHVQRLRDLGLATDRPGIAMETLDGDVVEVFEWVSEEAIASAHEHPEVRAMWAEYEQCCAYIPVAQIAQAGDLFPDYTPLPTVGGTWPG